MAYASTIIATIAYAARIRPRHEPRAAPAPLDVKDLLARVVMHIPDPRRHVIRCHGAYSSVVRARRRWVQLIRRIYEVDPLVCPRCGATMRIVAFVTEPKVIRKILLHLAATGIDVRSPPGPRERHPTAA